MLFDLKTEALASIEVCTSIEELIKTIRELSVYSIADNHTFLIILLQVIQEKIDEINGDKDL